MADFKYGVTFNTHGNTSGSVNPSPSTQQDVSNGVTFLKMCVLLDQIMFVIVKNSNMLGR